MHPEKLRYVTYQELQQAAGEAKGLVLVDLREAPAEASDSASGQGQGRLAARKAAGRTAESDLGRRFAGTEQVRPPRERSRDGKEEASVAALPRSKDPGRVFVLVDDGNGEAEKVARRIRAAGLGQAVILAGGSQAIERDGQPGRRSQEVKARR
jgi:rhodanese-related sulfurtransferase